MKLNLSSPREQWRAVDELWGSFLRHAHVQRFTGQPLWGSLREIHEELHTLRKTIPRPKTVAYRWMGFEAMSRGLANYVLDKLEAEIVATARGKPRPDFLLLLIEDPQKPDRMRYTPEALDYLIRLATSVRISAAATWHRLARTEMAWKDSHRSVESNAWIERREECESQLALAKEARSKIGKINQNLLPNESRLLPHQIQAFQLYFDTVIVEPLEALSQAIRIHYGPESGVFHGLPE